MPAAIGPALPACILYDPASALAFACGFDRGFRRAVRGLSLDPVDVSDNIFYGVFHFRVPFGPVAVPALCVGYRLNVSAFAIIDFMDSLLYDSTAFDNALSP